MDEQYREIILKDNLGRAPLLVTRGRKARAWKTTATKYRSLYKELEASQASGVSVYTFFFMLVSLFEFIYIWQFT